MAESLSHPHFRSAGLASRSVAISLIALLDDELPPTLRRGMSDLNVQTGPNDGNRLLRIVAIAFPMSVGDVTNHVGGK